MRKMVSERVGVGEAYTVRGRVDGVVGGERERVRRKSVWLPKR